MTTDKPARCSRCDEEVGAVVIDGGRATIRLSTSSHGDTLPIACPRMTTQATKHRSSDGITAVREALRGRMTETTTEESK